MLKNDSYWYQNLKNCTVLKESRHKRLLRGTIDPGMPHQSYLIKIYFYPGLWQALKYVFRKSKAHRELSLAEQISEKGIPTIVPRQAKDIRKRGLLQKSVVLLEYLPDCMNLEERLLQKQVADRQLRRKILREYGQLARLIHDAGVYQNDFDPNNILYQEHANGSFQLYLVDFEKTRIVTELSFGQRAHSLAKLNRMGQKLKKTDQMRFLTAYLGPQAIRKERRKWAKGIRQEEKAVFLKDQRRARRKSTSISKKIGFLKYNDYRGYYRKRHHSRNFYRRTDIIGLIHLIEKNIAGEALPSTLSERFLEISARLYDREEIFRVCFFEYGGLKYRLPGGIKRTPLIAAWRNDNGYLKNRSVDFLPVAALEKKTSWNRYLGFLIRRN